MTHPELSPYPPIVPFNRFLGKTIAHTRTHLYTCTFPSCTKLPNSSFGPTLPLAQSQRSHTDAWDRGPIKLAPTAQRQHAPCRIGPLTSVAQLKLGAKYILHLATIYTHTMHNARIRMHSLLLVHMHMLTRTCREAATARPHGHCIIGTIPLFISCPKFSRYFATRYR